MKGTGWRLSAPRYQRRRAGAEKDMQKKQQKLDLRMRDEEAKLASERKKIQDQKELEKRKERHQKGCKCRRTGGTRHGSTLLPPNFL